MSVKPPEAAPLEAGSGSAPLSDGAPANSKALLEFAARLRRLSGAIISPLEKRVLSPYRERGKQSPLLDKAGNQRFLEDGLLATYALCGLAVLDLERLLRTDREESENLLVVPSLTLHFPNLFDGNRDGRPDSSTKRRFHWTNREDDDGSGFGVDSFRWKNGASRSTSSIIGSLDQEGSPNGKGAAILRAASSCCDEAPSTRAALLNQQVFLRGYLARQNSFSTGEYFTRMPAKVAIEFTKIGGVLASADGCETIAVHEGLGHATEALAAVCGVGVTPAGTDLEGYVRFVRIALALPAADDPDKTVDAWREARIVDEASTLGTGTVWDNHPHQCMTAISCFDPIIGRSDGTLIVYSKRSLNPVLREAIQELCVPVLTAFGRLDETLADYDGIRAHALRSTVSGILARSMAHDIGSHMLAASHLETLKADVGVTPSTPCGIDAAVFDHLKAYLRQRMVWLAETTTSDPTWSETLSLQRDVIEPFIGMAPALDGAAQAPATDSLRSPVTRFLGADLGVTAIDVKVRHQDGTEVTRENDIAVSIPTGIVGAHALYAILENVSRNAIRHSGIAPGGGTLTLTLQVADDPEYPEYLGVEVSDSFSKPEAYEDVLKYFPPDSNDSSLGLPVSADAGAAPPSAPTEKPTASDAPPETASAADWVLVDASGRPNRKAWGIKEMRIAAAWLRGGALERNLREEEMGTLKPALFVPSPRSSTGDSGTKTFCFRFWLRKPARLLVIKADGDSANDDGRRRIGVTFVTDPASLPRHASAFEIVLVSLPSNESERQEWIRTLQSRRDELSPVLLIAGPAAQEAKIELEPAATLPAEPEWPSEPTTDAWADLFSHIRSSWWPSVAFIPKAPLLIIRPKNGTVVSEQVRQELDASFKKLLGEKACVSTALEAPSTMDVGSSAWLLRHHSSPYAVGGLQCTFQLEYSAGTSTEARVEELVRTRVISFLAPVCEAALLRVLVVDERFAELATSGAAQAYLNAGVSFPSGFEYSAPAERHLEDVVGRFLRLSMSVAHLRTSALLIHRGLLDTIPGKGRSWLRRVLGENPSLLVIVLSDRGGVDDDWPPGTRFLPFAAVEAAIRGEDKTHLSQLVLSSRGLARSRR